MLWQRFPSELVAARAQLGLPRSLVFSFPSFLPSGVGWGRGCPLSQSGSGWRYQDRALSHPQGGSSARRPSSARAVFPPGPQPSRYSRAQASSSNSSSCLEARGLADRSPSLKQAAAPGSRQWQRKPLRAQGRRHGARARARAELGVRARAANRDTPPHTHTHSLSHAAKAAARGKRWVGLGTHLPHPDTAHEGVGLHYQGHPSTKKVHSAQLLATGYPKGIGGEEHTPAASRHKAATHPDA